MYTGDIETFGQAIEYAEKLYRDAYRESQDLYEAMEDAVDAFFDVRETADAKTLARLKRKVKSANRQYVNAFKRAEYHRAYLQGYRDFASIFS